jgi:hypothetical protein|eukprot:evm.model.NODE_31236_length_39405_cov_67.395760.9
MLTDTFTGYTQPTTGPVMADPFDGLFGDLPAAAKKEELAIKNETQRQQQQQQQQQRPVPPPTDDDQKKQQEEDASHTSSKKRARQEDKDDDGRGTAAAIKPATLDLKEALDKITRALTSAKLEKSRKALGLLTKLMAGNMNAENAAQFHATIAFFMATDGTWDRLLGPAAEDREQAVQLLSLVKERILLFGPEEQYRAATWILLGSLRSEMLTDDTFEFRRAARNIKEYIVALQAIDDEDETYADKERRRAILACLATALRQNLHSWAKPSIEDLFKAATEKRMIFPEDEREELDEMSTKLRQAARGLSVNPTGTVISRSVRMVNSMATPFNTKKADIYR